jgi:hypothetical protein
VEQQALTVLPKYQMAYADVEILDVDPFSTVRFDRNRYSKRHYGWQPQYRQNASIYRFRCCCLQGWPPGLLITAPALAPELAEAQDKYQLRRIEQGINKAALLIVDDLSYITFNRRHSELLFKLIAERTESASIISTNLEFSRWTELFEDPMLTIYSCHNLLSVGNNPGLIIINLKENFLGRRLNV